MCEQNVSYLAKHSELGSNNLKPNLPENYPENTKIAIAACKFSKFFRGACPRIPLQLFLFLNQLQISSAEKKKLKKCGNYGPPFSKCFATPLPALVGGEKNLVIDFGPPPHTLEMLPPSLYLLEVCKK